MWHTVVLIPNMGEDYHGTDLVEVAWKVATVILNAHFTTYIASHDVLHGFWEGRGIGTTFLEAKLLHQLSDLREECL